MHLGFDMSAWGVSGWTMLGVIGMVALALIIFSGKRRRRRPR